MTKQTQASQLKGAEALLDSRSLIIVSNRAPVTFHRTEAGELTFERGGGGLVTALLGLCRHADVTWIASAQSEADRGWGEGRLHLEDESEIRLRFVTPTPEAYHGYYNVIANPLLWFLQHSMWDVPRAPIIDGATWEAWHEGYVTVNRLFAQAIEEQVRATEGRILVMLQDYHLYLAARYLRSALKPRQRPSVLHFTHIPWPGPEYWGILPPEMRETILDGLLAVDLLGFQTEADSLNFMRSCDALLERAYPKYRRGSVWYRNHRTHVRDFPISIDVAALRETAASAEVAAHREELGQITEGRRLILRIDRLEPSKNILRGFRAFEDLLEHYPEHREQVKFLALLVPSRLGVDEYQDYLDELMAAGGRINANYGSSDWEPVRILVGQNYPRAVAAMQDYEVLLVNSIADGMNLVAKEGPIVNEADGVLILSDRAGAHQQLKEGALVISPCDVYATTEALHSALSMPRAERARRASELRALVEREDIMEWLYGQLRAVSRLKL